MVGDLEFHLCSRTSLMFIGFCWLFIWMKRPVYWGAQSSQNERSSVKSWLCPPEVEGVGRGVQCLLLQFLKLGLQFLQFMFRLQSRDVADIDSQGQAGMIIW